MNSTNVIVLCELSTLKCDKFQFGKFLNQYSKEVININDHIWLVMDYQQPTTPFEADIENIITDLELQGYSTEKTNCISIIPNSVNGRFEGLLDLMLSKK